MQTLPVQCLQDITQHGYGKAAQCSRKQRRADLQEDHDGGGGESLWQEPCTEGKHSQPYAQPALTYTPLPPVLPPLSQPIPPRNSRRLLDVTR